jgi:hypothetical protein
MNETAGFFDSPEMEQLRKDLEEAQENYKKEVDSFWDKLSYDDKLKAFSYVVSKIYEGDVKLRGSYRYVLYNLFSFEMDAYTRGIDCGYLNLHNIIHEGVEFGNLKNANKITLNNNCIAVEGNNKFKFDYNEETKELTISIVDLMNWEI